MQSSSSPKDAQLDLSIGDRLPGNMTTIPGQESNERAFDLEQLGSSVTNSPKCCDLYVVKEDRRRKVVS
uniref:Ovule protein n=1 Tax=Caenorhabditis tropicalis TaxID=1561998 RepID=A0A1I7TLB1_9PELO